MALHNQLGKQHFPEHGMAHESNGWQKHIAS
jgi:hypothetical protein